MGFDWRNERKKRVPFILFLIHFCWDVLRISNWSKSLQFKKHFWHDKITDAESNQRRRSRQTNVYERLHKIISPEWACREQLVLAVVARWYNATRSSSCTQRQAHNSHHRLHTTVLCLDGKIRRKVKNNDWDIKQTSFTVLSKVVYSQFSENGPLLLIFTTQDAYSVLSKYYIHWHFPFLCTFRINSFFSQILHSTWPPRGS